MKQPAPPHDSRAAPSHDARAALSHDARAALSANRNFVQSLAKGLDILAEFSDGQLLGNQELVARTGLPKIGRAHV